MSSQKDALERTSKNASSVSRNHLAILCALLPGKFASEKYEPNVADVDWGEIIRLAEHHGVVPLLARNVFADHTPKREGAGGYPQAFLDALRSSNDENMRRSLWFTAELTRVLQHFEKRQSRVVPYKGPVLAQQIYGDTAMRSFHDLDFLIAPADFWRAKGALAELAYRPGKNMSAAVERLWLRNGYERAFDGPRGKNLIELQWRLLPRFYAVDLSAEELMARAGRIALAECEVPCLSPEDSLLVQCLHAAKHLWTRLIWLCDIRETLKLPGLDCELVFARAKELGIARMLGVSLWLVRNVLEPSNEAPVENQASPSGGTQKNTKERQKPKPRSAQKNTAEIDKMVADADVTALGRQFADRLRCGVDYDFESTEYFRLILKLRERRADRWKYLRRLAWTPGENDINAVNLPEGLSGFYGLVRLGRLLRKSVSGG
jgi:hypothetical protein